MIQSGNRKPQVVGEERYQVIRKKSRSGKEYITYKPIILYKEKPVDTGGNRAFRRAEARRKK